MMRWRSAGFVGALIGLALGVGARRAQASAELVGQGEAEVAAGATDNAVSAPAGTALVQSSTFLTVRGTLRGAVRLPLDTHTLSYQFGQTLFFQAEQANGQTHALSWNWIHNPGSRAEWQFLAAGTYSRLNSVIPLSTAMAETATPAAIPSGPREFLGASAGVAVTLRPTARALWLESLATNVYAPLGQGLAPGLNAVNLIRGEQTHGRNGLSIEGTQGYMLVGETRDSFGDVVTPRQETLDGRALLGWRREISADWSTSVAAGGLATTRVEGGAIVVGPAWHAGVTYTRPGAVARADLDRIVQPNLYLGQALVADALTARLALPLDRAARWNALGLASVQRSRLVTGSERLSTAMDLATASAVLRYQPLDSPLAVSLAYSWFAQRGNVALGQVFSDMNRQVLVLTVIGSWPRDRGGR